MRVFILLFTIVLCIFFLSLLVGFPSFRPLFSSFFSSVLFYIHSVFLLFSFCFPSFIFVLSLLVLPFNYFSHSPVLSPLLADPPPPFLCPLLSVTLLRLCAALHTSVCLDE